MFNKNQEKSNGEFKELERKYNDLQNKYNILANKAYQQEVEICQMRNKYKKALCYNCKQAIFGKDGTITCMHSSKKHCENFALDITLWAENREHRGQN